MKIVSINAKETTSANSVAFNVDAPPAEGVMALIKYGTLNIQFEGGLLYVSSRPNEPTIGKTVLNNLSEKIIEAERTISQKIAEKFSRQQDAVNQVSNDTGLPIA